jgi:sulfhydrogenase subunit beta (sulfur reductase)
VTAGGLHVLERERFDELFEALARRGCTVVGPTVADGAIVYAELRSAADLPVGWTDEQDGGHYRLTRRDDEALFGYAVGPHSWKRFQLPPEVRLFRARRGDDGSLTEIAEPPPRPRYAFLGARSCELHAMGILDRVLGEQREDVVIAVNCGQAGGTCFCVSTGTGPRARDGWCARPASAPRSRRRPTSPASTSSVTSAGTRASRSTTRGCTAAASGAPRARATASG